ncbi:MAG: sulfotransferase [Okeania sp. SIO3B5]|uniref:sulfotransferase n=1 Tax=Okeania sp. SIO3B5 TaxID=2607811 RepID=UPI0013FFEED1|nr:sulfotransferase [Okeania sp. SIO3B5]NEO54924.1 sulfotransferase [Okeania sp. SIO3B5]
MMSNSQTKFIITCAPRTGSTMLRMMLNSHPEIACYGEVMTLKGEPNLGKKHQNYIGKTSQELAQIRAENPANFLYNYIWNQEHYQDNCKAIGLKLKYRQLQEEFKDVFQAILDDKEIRIIHLTRRNLLKRYISNRLAASGKTSTVIFNSEKSQLQPKVTVDVDKCIEDILSVQQTEAQFRKEFKQHKIFEVAYEELVMSNSKILAKLMNFLEVDFINLQPVTEKVNSDSLEDIIENYDVVKNKLSQTKYATFIG